MRLIKIFVYTIILINFNLYAFDLFGNKFNNKALGSLIKDKFKSSFDKKLKKKDLKLSDILNMDVDKMVDANIINIPGLFGLGVKCDLDREISVPDICNMIHKRSIKLNFGFGPCKVGVGLSNACLVDLAKKMCNKEINKTISSPTKTLRSSAKELKVDGDNFVKKHSWKSTCENLFPSNRKKIIKNPNGVSLDEIQKQYLNANTVYSYGFNSVNAKNLFDSSLIEWKDCIFLNAKKKNMQYALEKCKNLKNSSLPKTEYDVDNEILSATYFLQDGIEDPLANKFDLILSIQANYIKKCSKSNDPQKCEEDLWENGKFTNNDGSSFSPKKIYNDELNKIEIANARFMKIVQYATFNDKTPIFISQEFINTLPPREKTKYKKLAEKQMYVKILNNYFIREITMNEKEIASIEYKTIKVASSQFYPQKAIADINKMIDIFKKLDSK